MSTVVKWGLITGMVYVFFSLISNLLGLQQGAGGGNIGLGLLVLTALMLATFFTIYLGVKETKEQDNAGYLTLTQGFLTGFKIALIAGVISAIFTLIYVKFIDPDMADRIMTGAEEQWENMPEERREMARKWAGYATNPFVLSAFQMISAIFWGVIKALVAGLILKKDPPVTSPLT